MHTTAHETCPTGAPAAALRFAATGPPADAELSHLRAALLRRARWAVRDHSVAEDLVQDTLLAVLQQHSRRRGASLRTWSLGILKHKVADWYRSPRRQRAQEERELIDDGPGAGDAAADQPQPEQWLEQRKRLHCVSSCLTELPRQTSRVLVMHDWLGFDNAEICARLDVSSANCRTLLHRARSALRQCVQRDATA